MANINDVDSARKALTNGSIDLYRKAVETLRDAGIDINQDPYVKRAKIQFCELFRVAYDHHRVIHDMQMSTGITHEDGNRLLYIAKERLVGNDRYHGMPPLKRALYETFQMLFDMESVYASAKMARVLQATELYVDNDMRDLVHSALELSESGSLIYDRRPIHPFTMRMPFVVKLHPPSVRLRQPEFSWFKIISIKYRVKKSLEK
ncbi:MAG: hypothetical protein HYW24_04845 [Candidatus Aenigmarchaeota archaeon]|nr:hypothetical protein [Candidatus Aenigmarchaeota archaeon]